MGRRWAEATVTERVYEYVAVKMLVRSILLPYEDLIPPPRVHLGPLAARATFTYSMLTACSLSTHRTLTIHSRSPLDEVKYYFAVFTCIYPCSGSHR